ncbi:TATA-binding protein-associated phosphoprotein, putative [Entamoeba histolytica HM-3:IMSS]|nr:TATA-binding associated phosphoprotein, putative [Entamoeba histolytica KU27]EMS11899.1 TATA-binding protein-associated phosphoprotein, putative [Entamoeba histolytica HM-3:IMSS]GAT93087.1 hypothetical protein CL6EHI_069090 [Entamoeba histolytica]
MQMASSYSPRSQFEKTRNYMACQQAILIGLLNEEFKVTIQKPVKKASVTQQYLNIRLIQRKNDVIEIDHFVEERCAERKEHDINSGVSISAAKQRVGKNKITELNLLLIDILNMLGYTFTTTTSEGKNGAMKNESIKSVYRNGKYLCGKEGIVNIGKKINKYLCELIEKNNEITIDYNDISLREYINSLVSL